MLVGRDTRASGPALERALAPGSPPAAPTSSRRRASDPRGGPLAEDAGAVVSASHNPAEYNGVKFFRGGWKLEDAEEEAIEALLEARPEAGAGESRRPGSPSRYVDLVCERFGAPLEGCASCSTAPTGP